MDDSVETHVFRVCPLFSYLPFDFHVVVHWNTGLRCGVPRKIQSTWGIPFYSKGHGLEFTVYLRVEA